MYSAISDCKRTSLISRPIIVRRLAYHGVRDPTALFAVLSERPLDWWVWPAWMGARTALLCRADLLVKVAAPVVGLSPLAHDCCLCWDRYKFVSALCNECSFLWNGEELVGDESDEERMNGNVGICSVFIVPVLEAGRHRPNQKTKKMT